MCAASRALLCSWAPPAGDASEERTTRVAESSSIQGENRDYDGRVWFEIVSEIRSIEVVAVQRQIRELRATREGVRSCALA